MQNVKRIGKYTLSLTNEPKIIGRGSIVGKKEGEGPLGTLFDFVEPDSMGGLCSFEKAESALQKRALSRALSRAHTAPEKLDMLFGGDLQNQCSGSSFAAQSLNTPFFGLYGACSTMAESIMLASLAVDGGYAKRAAAVTSSHFCAAERQFRFPLEYGGQRSQNAQWTVTGSGAVVLAQDAKCYDAKVVRACPGRILNYNIKDASNMGAAMAPAAADTLLRFFADTGTAPKDFDRIITGDLAAVGSELFCEIMEKNGVSLRSQHDDCGLMIFEREKQDVHAGGSGCGCCASVLCAKILPSIASGEWKNVLFIATGAYMSPTTAKQGEPIIAVAHLLELKR